MNNVTKALANNALQSLSAKAPTHVLKAIESASQKTGVNFAYMLQQARAESNFNDNVQAKSSSASGLYQFIESTWMNMVERYGDKYGIETEGKSRSEILELRNDAEISANMAAEFASENERFLESNWGGDIGSTELYFAHFMGAGGAASFLKSHDENPMQAAADLFPQAARANYNVFYERETGRARSLDEVYAFFDKKFSIKDEGAESTQLADNKIKSSTEALNSLYTYKITPIDHERTAALNSVFSQDHMAIDMLSSIETSSHSNTYSYNSLIPSSYNSLLSNPLELMLLSELDLTNKNSSL
ncbi:MAG: hypothetical protein CMH26_05820 [Micavibrio sp.]|nr:hypothetical protein [Micavibrio sp.]|tara:strand:- start:596 stop:1504 length:909 start_codon:yes stop_codon:yes gene_type:complete